MHTYNEHNQLEEDVNLEEFVGSQYLSKDDLAPGEETTVTIAEVSIATMRESNRKKPVLRFKEFHKGLVLNNTNNKRLQRILGVTKGSELLGRHVVLYVDEEVAFGGKCVGGIRIKRASEQSVAAAKAKARRINEEADIL